MQLRARSGDSARKGGDQDGDARAKLCITQPVRRFGASAAVRAVVFRFGRPVPNHQFQRTRSGGLRPPARAAELRR
jgi:hypothetical protein